MFWRRKKAAPAAPPQIGCFGKLPATGDFIRLNAGGDEIAAFDRWLGGAIDRLHAAPEVREPVSLVFLRHVVTSFVFPKSS